VLNEKDKSVHLWRNIVEIVWGACNCNDVNISPSCFIMFTEFYLLIWWWRSC